MSISPSDVVVQTLTCTLATYSITVGIKYQGECRADLLAIMKKKSYFSKRKINSKKQRLMCDGTIICQVNYGKVFQK